MHLTEDILRLLRAHFAKYPTAQATTATSEAIAILESLVGYKLPDDYKDFVLTFGAGVVGPYSIYGIGQAELMTDEESSAWQVTTEFRKKQWPGVNDWLVVSMDHSGNPVGIDREGVVWISDHDFGGVTRLFDSFEQYLRRTCLKVV